MNEYPIGDMARERRDKERSLRRVARKRNRHIRRLDRKRGSISITDFVKSFSLGMLFFNSTLFGAVLFWVSRQRTLEVAFIMIILTVNLAVFGALLLLSTAKRR